jgi:O-antigen/teichoic acid export membrane protein
VLFVRDFMLAAVLGPISYGVWIQFVVFFNYALHLPLGFQHVMSRDVPYYVGKRNFKRVSLIQNITFFVTLITAILAGFFFIISNSYFDSRFGGFSLLTILIVFMTLIAQQLNAFFSILLRAHQKFNIYSIGFVLIAILSLVLGYFFAKAWGFSGAVAALGIAFTMVTFFWLYHSPYMNINIRALIEFAEFKKIGKIALPLFFSGLLGLLIVSIDRLIIIFFYDDATIGYYGFAFMISQSIALVTMPVTQAVYPRMMMSFAKHGKPEKIEHYLAFITQGVSFGVIFLIGVIYLLVEPIIENLLPDFVPAIKIIHIMLLGKAFATIANGANMFSVAINKQIKVLIIQIVMTICLAAAICCAGYLGAEITLIAVFVVLANLVYAFLSLVLAGFGLRDSSIEGLSFGFKSCLAILCMLFCMILTDYFQSYCFVNVYTTKIIQLLLWLMAVLFYWVLFLKKKICTNISNPNSVCNM